MLDKYSYAFLRDLYKKGQIDRVNPGDYLIKSLVASPYVKRTNMEFEKHGVDPVAYGLSISPEGKTYVEQRQNEKRIKTEEWMRWSVTTVIALAAFIKSFFFTP